MSVATAPLPNDEPVHDAGVPHAKPAPAELTSVPPEIVKPAVGVTASGPPLVTVTVNVAFDPAFTLADPAMAAERSELAFTVTVAVAELFAGFGSGTPGADALAVFDIVPTAVPLAIRVIVSVAPGPRLAMVQFAPLPVHDAVVALYEVNDPPLKALAMVIPAATDGPLFTTVTEKVAV